MAELKTKKNNASVSEFLNAITDEQKRDDCKALSKLMSDITKAPAVMWGPSIVGFGSWRYTNTRGTSDWFLVGFSPRKANITLYIMTGFTSCPDLMKKLGTYKTGKSCLYIKRLSDLDQGILKDLIKESIVNLKSGGLPTY